MINYFIIHRGYYSAETKRIIPTGQLVLVAAVLLDKSWSVCIVLSRISRARAVIVSYVAPDRYQAQDLLFLLAEECH